MKACEYRGGGVTEREFCSFVYSNRYADPIREKIFDSLSNYKKVNSGGRYLNNIDQPNGIADKLDFQKQHKFCIACENSKHSGYTTEKLVEAFAAQTVPIYWGDPNVVRVFNPKAFINVFDYSTLEEVVLRVREIDNNDELYMSMLSEPAVLFENDLLDNKLQELETFIYHIFDQKYEDAFRRNRVYWGNRYFYKQVRWHKAFSILHLDFDNAYLKKIRNRARAIYHKLKR